MPAGQQGPYATMHNHTHHAHDDTLGTCYGGEIVSRNNIRRKHMRENSLKNNITHRPIHSLHSATLSSSRHCHKVRRRWEHFWLESGLPPRVAARESSRVRRHRRSAAQLRALLQSTFRDRRGAPRSPRKPR